MALPYGLRPSILIRRRAIYRGVLGPSKLWKGIAAIYFGRSSIKKFFGKHPEKIAKTKIGANSFLNVINAKPMTKKQAKQAGVTKPLLISQASADVASAWAVKAANKPSRKNRRRADKTARAAAEAQRKLAKTRRKAVKRAS